MVGAVRLYQHTVGFQNGEHLVSSHIDGTHLVVKAVVDLPATKTGHFGPDPLYLGDDLFHLVLPFDLPPNRPVKFLSAIPEQSADGLNRKA